MKQENKDASNAEISKILSRMWKEAPEDLKKEYTDKEAKLREEYKVKIAEWRVEQEKNKKIEKDPLEIYQEKEEERKRKGYASDDDEEEEDDDDSLDFSVDGKERKRFKKRSKKTASPIAKPFTGVAGGMGLGGLQSNDLTQMMYARNLGLSNAQFGHPSLASPIASQQMQMRQPGMLPALSSNMALQPSLLMQSSLARKSRLKFICALFYLVYCCSNMAVMIVQRVVFQIHH